MGTELTHVITVDSIAHIHDIHTDQYADGTPVFANLENAQFVIRKSSTNTPDGVSVIQPRIGSGRIEFHDGMVALEVPFSTFVVCNNTTSVYDGPLGADLTFMLAEDGHVEGGTHTYLIPANTVATIEFVEELGQIGDLFDPANDYIIKVQYNLGQPLTATRSRPPADVAAPTVVSASAILSADPRKINVTFNEVVGWPNTNGMSVSWSVGTPSAVVAITGSGTPTLAIELAADIQQTDVLSVAFSSSARITDGGGNRYVVPATVPVTVMATDFPLASVAHDIWDIGFAGGITLDAGEITNVLNLKAGPDLEQALAIARPGYIASDPAYNNNATATFDGIAQFLQTATNGWAFNSPTATLVFVGELANVANALLVDTSDATMLTNLGFMLIKEGGVLAARSGPNANYQAGAAYAVASKNLIMGVFDVAVAPYRQLYLGGTSVASDGTDANVVPPLTNLFVGRLTQVAGYFLPGKMAFLAVLPVKPTAPQIAQIHAWAIARFGVP